jgi:hypothetical protein
MYTFSLTLILEQEVQMAHSIRCMYLGLIFILMTGLSSQCAPRTVYVRKAPPPVRVEVKPAPPFAKAVWIPGYWKWQGKKYVWIGGSWKKPRKGYIWVPGHWVKKKRGWFRVEGHWKRR